MKPGVFVGLITVTQRENSTLDGRKGHHEDAEDRRSCPDWLLVVDSATPHRNDKLMQYMEIPVLNVCGAENELCSSRLIRVQECTTRINSRNSNRYKTRCVAEKRYSYFVYTVVEIKKRRQKKIMGARTQAADGTVVFLCSMQDAQDGIRGILIVKKEKENIRWVRNMNCP